MSDQRSLFRILKPPCVAASEAALGYQAGKFPSQHLTARLEDLLKVLKHAANVENKDHLDAKLAEYVFFPLSHVFRQRQSVTVRVLELAIQCLQILLSTGWRKDMSPELAIQLMVLLTFIASDSEGHVKAESTTDELLEYDFACLRAVIRSLTSSPAGRGTLTATANVPALGHCITSILGAITTPTATGVGEQALEALRPFVEGLDRDVLASFLPGIISNLTKVLTPSSTLRRPYNVLTFGLDLVARLLSRVLSNEFNFESKSKSPSPSNEAATTPQLNQSWLTATAGQLKLALGNIVKQRHHERDEVRSALRRLCMTVLQNCSRNLADCVPMMLDTLVMLSQADHKGGAISSLEILLFESPEYAEHLKNSLYSHMLALPRIIMSNDSHGKENQIAQIISIMNLLNRASIELSVAENIVMTALHDSVAGSFQQAVRDDEASHGVLSIDGPRALASGSITSPQVFPRLVAKPATQENLALVSRLLQTLASTEDSSLIVRDCLDRMQVSAGNDLLVNVWLALQLMRFRSSSLHDADDFLNIDVMAPDEVQQREELFAFALNVLTRNEDGTSDHEADWRVTTLALEAVAYQATSMKKAFQAELSDVLYPVLHHLGSSMPQIQSHAMVAINSIAASTGYSSAQQLIVENNDYLINGIALKLSTFELSPQAPRVLNMLVRLCGAKLLPFLDDLTDTIFEALEYYHGYDSLVDLLFQCLGSMVEEGVRAPALTIQDARKKDHRLEFIEPTSPSGLAIVLRERQRRASLDEQQEKRGSEGIRLKAPHKPWKETAETDDEKEDQDIDERPSAEEAQSPLSRQYQLVHRITNLTQHHLPSGNPLIRSHLSHVISTAVPYLAQHEDTFLPLIHTLWPVVVPRLHDSEASVVAGALEVIAKMTEGSGEFIRGRVADIWDDIRSIHRRIRNDLDGPKGVKPSTQARLKHTEPSSSVAERRLMQGELSRITKSGAHDSVHSHTASDSAPSESGLELSVSSTRALNSGNAIISGGDPAQNDQSRTYIGGHYVSSTSLTLYRALTSFLVSLITHVDVAAWIFDEVLTDMLFPYVVASSTEAPWIGEKTREVVLQALQERNADAVWLVQLRHGMLAEEAEKFKNSPIRDVDDAVPFASLVTAC